MTTILPGGADPSTDQLCELGFYTLAGHTDTPFDLVQEARRADELGLGAAFVSERFHLKDATAVCGALAVASGRLGIATAATNINTRHPLVTATFGATMHRLSAGRFALGVGRGVTPVLTAMGLAPSTSAELEDATALLRRLWRGERVVDHDGPFGRWPSLQLQGKADEDVPVLLVALGEKTCELVGRCMDGVVLHTFFSDEAVHRSVAAVRRGAEQAGRDPAQVRVWSVLATIGEHVPEHLRLKKTVGRLASYLRGYGDLLVRVNDWDPAVLARFRADPLVLGFRGAFDATATPQELEHLATLLPSQWWGTAATGTPEQAADAVVHQLDLGADSVILHGATPDELAPLLPAYRAVRPAHLATAPLPANPGRSLS